MIIGGKGGVGRTTVAAALGIALARRGRRTLLAHVRCKQRLDQLLGCDEVGEEITPVEPDLWAVNMNPEAAIREMGLMVLRFRTVYRAVMENRIARSFLRAVPALEEYSMIGKAWYHTTEMDGDRPRFDTVVFDGPATGHLISMLRIPGIILDAVPEGPLTTDARKARAMLSNRSQTAMWIVTMAEEMPASEARDLFCAAREELDIGVERLVVNNLYPPELTADPEFGPALDAASDQCAEAGVPQLEAVLRSAQTIRRRRLINESYLRRFDQEIPLPRSELPNLFVAELDREALERIVEIVEQGL